jgi:hypothetical protein
LFAEPMMGFAGEAVATGGQLVDCELPVADAVKDLWPI